MPNWVSFFFLWLPLSLLSTEATLLRRILHQPFFPLDSLPPAEPPLPESAPKHPLSDSPPSPPTDSPFFPAIAASPPPPPSPVAFASFPANISSLILPHTPSAKHGSAKLVALSVAAVVSALAVLAVAVCFFYYRRRTRSDISDDKTFRSENSSRLFPAVGGNAGTRAQKLRAGGSSASSEFLYLGTLVDSRRIEEGARSSRSGRSESRKMESPELHPLPPLLRQSLGLSGGVESGAGGAAANSTADEEDEEFYSPRGSLGTGSSSRRVLAAAAGESFRGRTSSASSSCSCSRSPSPDSSSPKRPAANSMLPVSSNLRSHPSPPTETNRETSPVRSRASSSPQTERVEDKSSASSSPKIASDVSFHVQNLRSPSPISSPKIAFSSADSSPERASEIPVHRLSYVPGRVQYVQSPSLSPIASSPERILKNAANELSSGSSSPETIAAMKNLDRLRSSSPSLSASPEGSPAKGSNASANDGLVLSQKRDFERNSDESSSISGDSVELFDFNPHRLSPSSSSSPDRVTEKEPDSSPRVPDTSESYRKRHSPSPSLSSPDRVLYEDVAISATATELLPPERDSVKNDDKYSGISDASEGALFELDPKKACSEREFNEDSDASARSSINAAQSAVSPTRTSTIPIPPPPPPPPPPSLRLWEAPSPSLPKPPALVPPSPFVLHSPTNVSISPAELLDDAQKPKLKPLHWDKVRASSDREMVWDQLGSSSFKLNEEMIETLFVVKTPISKPKETTPRSVLPSPGSENRVLDPKKSQNIAISLRALSVTIEEICEALLEGNADALGNELLESLLKMAPTKEEERKLKEYKDDSPAKLGPAERFLKAVLEVPNAFKRVDAMLYIANFESEVDYLKKSFQTLEGACEELRNSRMFFKLLEAVLKTGNRMNVGTNRGDARAFKLDTLLKLVDVKGADGKTTLLHFVVQEIIRTEGARYSNENDDAKCRRLGLQVVSGLSSELAEVKKAAAMDSDVLANDVAKLSRGITNITEVVRLNGDETHGKFAESMDMFVKMAEEEILQVRALESVALSLVKEITEYFHGNSTKEEAHPFRIFLVVRDFLAILDRVCKEVGMINERTTVSSAHRFPVPVNPLMAQVLPVPPGNRPNESSDDDL